MLEVTHSRRPRIGAISAAVLLAVAVTAPALSAQSAPAKNGAPKNGAAATKSSAAPPAVDPKGVAALRTMGAYLRTLNRFTIQAEGTRDDVLSTGQKVQIAGTVAYTVERPNRLRADIRTDRKVRQVYYDGKTLTIFAPRMNYYSTLPAPNTIRAMMDSAERVYGIELPLADLFDWGTDRDGTSKLTSAKYIGPAYIAGADTDHWAFQQDGVDWQLWITRGSKPFPAKLVITTKSIESQPQYSMTLRWNANPTFDSKTFAFAPASNVKKIPFVPAVKATASR